MDGIRLHENSFAGRYRTRVLTRAAADAILVVYFRNGELAVRHHPHRFCRAVFGTSPAISLLRFYNAIFFYKIRFADLK